MDIRYANGASGLAASKSHACRPRGTVRHGLVTDFVLCGRPASVRTPATTAIISAELLRSQDFYTLALHCDHDLLVGVTL
jgi:hypothetical protein